MNARQQIQQQLAIVVRSAQDPWSPLYNNRIALIEAANGIEASLANEPGIPLGGRCLDWLDDGAAGSRAAWRARGCNGWASNLAMQLRGMGAALAGYDNGRSQVFDALVDQIERGEQSDADVIDQTLEDVREDATQAGTIVAGAATAGLGVYLAVAAIPVLLVLLGDR